MTTAVSRRDTTVLWAIVLAACVIRLFVSDGMKGHRYAVLGAGPPKSEVECLKQGEINLGDSQQYELLGASIRHGHYGWDDKPNTFRTPGYPLLIALVNDKLAPLLVAQALLGALTVLFVGLTGQRLFEPRVGLVAAALTALDVPAALYSGLVMSETLFAFCVLLATWLFVSGEWPAANREQGRSHTKLLLAASGLALGFAALVRPVALLAFVPFAAILAARRHWRALALMLGLFVVLPGLWTARNYVRYRQLSLTSNGGYNLFYANAAALVAEERGIAWDSARTLMARGFAAELPGDNPLVVAGRLSREALRIIGHDPIRYSRLVLRRTVWVIAGVKADDLILRMRETHVSPAQGREVRQRQYGVPGVRLAALALSGFELLATLGMFLLAWVAVFLRPSRGTKVMLLVLALYFILAASPFTDGRFRVPAMPFIYLTAASLFRRRAVARRGT